MKSFITSIKLTGTPDVAKAEKILAGAGLGMYKHMAHGRIQSIEVLGNNISPAQVAQLLEKDFVVIKEYGKANYFIQ